MSKKLIIRNSAAEFLIFTSQAGEDGIEVRVQDKNVWLTQKLIVKLFDVNIPNINEHLKNIFLSKELDENSVVRNFRITAKDGKNYNTNHYNLGVIISLGYRINSQRATDFRRWATKVLNDAGKVTTEISKAFAESEFEKYRPIQDQLYESDFDKEVKKYLKQKNYGKNK